MPRANTTGVRGLYKREGRYEFDLRWREPSTGEHRRYQERMAPGITAAAAKTRARELLAACLAGGYDPRQEAPRRLSEGFKEYLRWCDANRPERKEKRVAACKRLVDLIGDKRIDEVAPFDVERFKRARLKGEGKATKEGAAARPVAPATVNRDLEILAHFYGLAVSWGWVDAKTAAGVCNVEHLKEPPGRVRHLSAEEEAKLLGELPAPIRRIVVTALLTGMRQEEVVKLQRSAVDLDARQLTLTKTKANKVRPVYLNDAVVAVLKEAMAVAPGEHVFVAARGRFKGKPYTCDGVRAIFRRACARAGVANFKFHDLRHTTATRLRRAGAGLDVVADVLGHATLSMARRYVHLGKESMRAAMNTLPAPADVAATAENQGRAETSARRRAAGS